MIISTQIFLSCAQAEVDDKFRLYVVYFPYTVNDAFGKTKYLDSEGICIRPKYNLHISILRSFVIPLHTTYKVENDIFLSFLLL